MMSESKTPESGVREQEMEAVVIPDQKLNYGIRAMMQERISREELDRAFDARFPKEMQEKASRRPCGSGWSGRTWLEYRGDARAKRSRKTAAGGF